MQLAIVGTDSLENPVLPTIASSHFSRLRNHHVFTMRVPPL